MKHKSGKTGLSGLEKWLALAIALVILGGLIFLNLRFEHERVTAREEDRLLAQARVIAENMEYQLASANQALLSTRSELVQPGRTVADWRHVTSHLMALNSAMPGIRTLSVLDAKGRVVASSRAELVNTDFSQRAYFQAALQHPAIDTLYVSPPFKTTLGVFALNLSRMIPGPNGEFAGIVTATVNPEFFKTTLASVLYAPDMWDAIAHGDGQLFLMVPERTALHGINLARPGSLFTRHLESGQTASVFTGTVYATHEVSMMAQHTVHPAALNMDKPLVVAVNRDLAAIYAPWHRNALAQSLLFVVISLVSVFALFGFQARKGSLEREAREARLLAERFSLALDRIPTFIYMKNRQRKYVYANKPTLELFKCSAAELHGSGDSRFFPPETVEKLHEIDTRVLQGEDTAEEVVAQEADGSRRVYAYLSVKLPLRRPDGAIYALCGISTDITERKALLEKLERQATRDYLTGLNNRRYFMERGETELAQAKRYGHKLSLLMLDIDRFKRINDTHGHKVGDIVLQQLAIILRNSFREVDIIGRIGGEEFAVLLPETGLAQATEVAERLRKNVAGTDLTEATGLPLRFTISIGVVELDGKDVSLDRLLELADKALYEAKQTGRNKVCIAS
jgi:diguanylate cyclase (GGDEF)-like protein/PAS domain S-box-containing protein